MRYIYLAIHRVLSHLVQRVVEYPQFPSVLSALHICMCDRSALATLLLDNSAVLSQGHFATATPGTSRRGAAPTRPTTSCATPFGRRGILHLFGLLSLLEDDLLVEFFAAAGENFLHILASLGGSLEALVNVVLSGEFDGAVEVDLPGALQFAFVADQVDSYIFSRVLFDLFEPTAKIFKGFVARDVVCKEDAMRTAIKNSSHRLE